MVLNPSDDIVDIIVDIKGRIEALERTREAAARLGNTDLARAAAFWSARLKSLYSNLHSLWVSVGSSLMMYEAEACNLVIYIDKLLNNILFCEYRFITEPIRLTLIVAREKLSRMCISSESGG